MSTTEPTVDPALEAAASALRADLAARGIPADELSEEVVLALAVSLAERDRRIGELERWLRLLYVRMSLRTILPEEPPAGFTGRAVNSSPEINEALRRTQSNPATYQPNPDGRYPLCLSRIGQADVCERCGETIDPAIERPCPWVPPEGRWVPSVPSQARVNLTALPPEAPRFCHGCPRCTFLGRSADGTRDLYWCEDTRSPVSVYGNSPGQFDRRDRGGNYPAEALRRAVARGLVGGAGEGG